MYTYTCMTSNLYLNKHERSQAPSCSKQCPGLSLCLSKVSGPTSTAWVARSTAPSLRQPCSLLSSSGGYLEFRPASFSFELSRLLFKLLLHPGPLLLGNLLLHILDTRHWPGIGMSSGQHGEGHIEPVKWETSKSQSRDLLSKPLSFCEMCWPWGTISGQPPSASVGSFDLVSSRADSTRPVSRPLETRAQIESSFTRCPSEWLRQASRLPGSATSGQDRVRRAWRAGQCMGWCCAFWSSW